MSIKKGIFRRIFILYAIVFLAALTLIEIYITATVKNNYISNLEETFSVQISLISEDINFKKTNIDAFCRELKGKIGTRITVITSNGKVIGDSDKDSSLMDNHLNRIEIEQAMLYNTGMTTRYSDTLKYDFLYIAKKIIRNGDFLGFVRVAVPLKDVDHSINILRIKIILVISLIMLATGIFSILQIDYLRRLLRQITDFSKSLARGEIERRLFLKNAGEFDEIAKNLTEMSEKLQYMIEKNHEEKKRLSVILKSIPDALLIIDSTGIVLLSSAASGKFFGSTEMLGKQYIEVVRSHDFFSLIDEVRKKGGSSVSEFRLEHPEEKYVAVRVSPLFYRENELSGYIAIFHDITKLKKLEQIRKDFVANVSHEIKTPITAIKGFADTLLEGALDDRGNALKFLKTIKSNSERINSLVDDLMTISRIELGVVRIEKSTVSTDEISENILAVFKSRAEEKGLYLKADINPEITDIYADKNRLAQILTNLVDNSIKFTEKGGVTFGLDKKDNKIFLFVEDTGIGIPKRDIHRLGERFYRVDRARSRELGGTGLGLAIVKHLVIAHGWEMKIESTQGKGTRVSIFSPAC